MQTTQRSDVRGRIRQVLADRFGEAALALDGDAPLTDALPAYDSLAAMEVVTAVEREFGIEVDFVSHDVRYSFATLERITDYVSDTLEDQQA